MSPPSTLKSNILRTTNFPTLKGLSLKFEDLTCDRVVGLDHESNNSYYIVGSFGHSACDSMLNRLAGVASQLETLCIRADDRTDPSWMRYVDKIMTLAQFQNLKHLSVPQDLLLGYGYGIGSEYRYWAPNPILNVFPSSLETLDISSPTLEIRGWLQKLLEHRSSFPWLRELCFSRVTGYGASFPDMYYDDDDIWDRLLPVGIWRQLTYRPEDEEYYWWGMDVAKNVDKVVQLIDDLDPGASPETWAASFFGLVEDS